MSTSSFRKSVSVFPGTKSVCTLTAIGHAAPDKTLSSIDTELFPLIGLALCKLPDKQKSFYL